MTKTWQDVAQSKCAERDALIPAEWRIAAPTGNGSVIDMVADSGILDAKELRITEMPADALVAAMTARDLTSEQVTLAFCKRAAIAQQLTNCLTEIFFTQALEDAKAIDSEYARTGKLRGPLHGLPVCLKDCVNIKGMDSTVGYINLAHKPATIDSDLTGTLRRAGAVLFCKTNVPTAMLMAETYNNLWGYTPNPYNLLYGAGGSSGGEGALLALRGAPLGVGTDIGGSIRIPAAVNGIYGLKPSHGRFSTAGGVAILKGQEAVRAVIGPMSPDLASIELWTKTVLADKPWERDPNVFRLPWREPELPEKLVFGIVMDDGCIRPTPAVTRVLKETRAALEAAGHTVVEWTPFDIPRGMEAFAKLIKGDGGVTIQSQMQPEGGIPEPWPAGLKAFGDAAAKAATSPALVSDLWKAQAERAGYVAEFLQHWYASAQLTGTGRPFDGVISPVAPYPAAPRYKFPIVQGCYTSVYNLADSPSLVFPAGTASRNDVKPDMTYRNDNERDAWENYDAEQLDGMPVGLQMLTLRHEEELAIRLARVAVAALAKK